MSNNNVQKPKTVVLGAGSLFFGRQSIWQMVHSPYLNNGTLALVDTNETRLNKMLKLARLVAEAENVKLSVEGSTDRRDVLKGADFVVLSFAEDSVKYRDIDCTISEKYGIRMCSGDTIGPGGIFRAMREMPVILECARDIEALCPDAWVINYINPTAVHGIALKRYAPKLKNFALCDGLHMPHVKRGYAKHAGIISRDEEYCEEISRNFDFRIAGVNHFTWLIKAEYEGRDVVPDIAASIKRISESNMDVDDASSKKLYTNACTYALYEIFGYIPTCIWHTKEYVRYWQGLGISKDNIPPLTLFNSQERYKSHEDMWETVDNYLSGKIPATEYIKRNGPDHATDIMENMIGGLGKPYYINTFNEGAVTNMSRDAFLELCCDITLDGIKAHPVGEMPRGIRGMQELVLDTHELTAEAIAERSFAKLRRAMMTDPLTNSIGDADNIIKELMELEREMLPKYWFE